MGRDRSRSPRRGARDDDEEDLPAEGKWLQLQFSLVFSRYKLTVLPVSPHKIQLRIVSLSTKEW